jgi:Uma2 family endonuclease
MVYDRHPDQAIYLDPEPDGLKVWTKWVPHIVVEIVSPGGEQRDFGDKREECLRAGVREYWILDTERRRMHALVRAGATWEETIVPETGTYRTEFLPGLEVGPAELLGPAAIE